MALTNFTENGLNVQYFSDFIEKECADIYFTQLRTLPFYTPTFRIRGKCVKPKRFMLGYGDANLNYAFNETHIPAEPWTPLILELRDRVEKFAGCSFNYVLLNLYIDGSSYIPQHKDDESGLNTAFPIVVLSFGVERTIEFKKPKTPSTFLKLEHGSLYSMLKPTNELFTHGMAPEPTVKDMRISLTFRHLLTNPIYPPLKKVRLQISDNQPISTAEKNVCDSSTNTCEKDCSFSSTCEKDCFPVNSVEKNLITNVCEKDITSTTASKDLCDRNEWLTSLIQQKDSMYSVLKQWNLNRNTFIKIVLDYNLNLRIHIRCFKEPKSGELIPTKEGIIMTASTWSHFIGKIQNFKFHSVNDSFICNNQLLVAYIDKKFCKLQQMYPINSPGFFLKPSVLKLFKDQIFKLLELSVEITESIVNAIFTIQFPELIVSQSSVCFSHLNVENARHNFLNSISSEVISCTNNLIECEACCLNISPDQSAHVCGKPVLEIFNLNKQSILLNLNLYNIIKNLRSVCMCHYDTLFLKQFNMKLYEECIKEILADHVNKH